MTLNPTRAGQQLLAILAVLVLGAQLAQEASHDEWKERPNQYEVPRADLIKAVRDILDRAS